MSHAVDIHVGQRIRRQRWLTGTGQQQLAEAVGVRFQQIHKYESGANRVSASRLWDIARVLDVPVSYFFEGLDSEGQSLDAATQDVPARTAVPATPSDIDLTRDKDACDLLRHYYAVPEDRRRILFDLTRALSERAGEAT